MKSIYIYVPSFIIDGCFFGDCIYAADRVVYEKSDNRLVFFIGEQRIGFVDCMYLEELNVYHNGVRYNNPWRLMISDGLELTDLTFSSEEVC